MSKNWKKEGRSNASKPDRKYRKGNSDKYEEMEKSIKSRGTGPNDWRWYALNEQLLRDTSSFPYAWPLGNPVNLGVGTYADKYAIPGVMAIELAPSIGYTDAPNSPVNIAARNVYSFVRHANSGHSNYDSVDLMIYLIAMGQVVSYISYLRRLYGTLMTYSTTNRYYPEAVVTAMKCNFQDLLGKIPSLRAYINNLSLKVGSMCVPATMSYYARQEWIYSGVWLDSDTIKSQTYMFIPWGFYRFKLDADGAGMLELSKLWATPEAGTLSKIMEYGNDLVDRIVADEDFNIMSGDILKAFSEPQIYKVPMIAEDYSVFPIYEETALMQIENCTLMGDIDRSSFSITQDTNKSYLKHTPLVDLDVIGGAAVGGNLLHAKKFVSFPYNGIEPAQTMEATRLTNCTEGTAIENRYLRIKSMGSEVATNATIYYYFDFNTGLALTNTRKLWMSNMFSLSFEDFVSDPSAVTFETALSNLDDLVEANFLLSNFNRHPRMGFGTYAFTGTGEGTFQTVTSPTRAVGDIDCYTVVDVDNLKEMANTALMSMFNVRQFGLSR